MTDGELLARFLSSRDDNALAALVRGTPRWYGASAAASSRTTTTLRMRFRPRSSSSSARRRTYEPGVANWLYGVARQTAVRLRALSAKRGRREKQW